jgi:hypothetical protein
MRRTRGALILLTGLALAVTGCSWKKHKRPEITTAPIPLEGTVIDGTTVVDAAPAKHQYNFFHNHPLFYKPANFYHELGHGPLTGTAAAIFLGIPAGIVCEATQIVVGHPPIVK